MATPPLSSELFQFSALPVKDEKPGTGQFVAREAVENDVRKPYMPKGGRTDEGTGVEQARKPRRRECIRRAKIEKQPDELKYEMKAKITDRKHLELIGKCEASFSAIAIIKMVKESLPFDDGENDIGKLTDNLAEVELEIRSMENNDKSGRIPKIILLIDHFEGQVSELEAAALKAMADSMDIDKKPIDPPGAGFLELFTLLDRINYEDLKALCAWRKIPEVLIPVLNGKLQKGSLINFIQHKEPGLFRAVGNTSDWEALYEVIDTNLLVSYQCQDGTPALDDGLVQASLVKAMFRRKFMLVGMEEKALENKFRDLSLQENIVLVDLLDIIHAQCVVSEKPSTERGTATLDLKGLAIAVGPSLFAGLESGMSNEQLQVHAANQHNLPLLKSWMKAWPDIRQGWLEGKVEVNKRPAIPAKPQGDGIDSELGISPLIPVCPTAVIPAEDDG